MRAVCRSRQCDACRATAWQLVGVEGLDETVGRRVRGVAWAIRRRNGGSSSGSKTRFSVAKFIGHSGTSVSGLRCGIIQYRVDVDQANARFELHGQRDTQPLNQEISADRHQDSVFHTATCASCACPSVSSHKNWTARRPRSTPSPHQARRPPVPRRRSLRGDLRHPQPASSRPTCCSKTAANR